MKIKTDIWKNPKWQDKIYNILQTLIIINILSIFFAATYPKAAIITTTLTTLYIALIMSSYKKYQKEADSNANTRTKQENTNTIHKTQKVP